MIKKLGVMVDCSRNAVYKVETFKKFMDIISKMGYNVLMLYTEDTYTLDDEPYFGYQRGRYKKEELKELDRYAVSKGIELIPCIQTLAHLSSVTRWQEMGSKVCDIGDILLVDNDETYKLIDKMFKTLDGCFTSRNVHIGMDEAWQVGLGRYLIDNGYKKQYEILNTHLNKVNEIAKKYGFNAMLWSDMFVKCANKGEYYPLEFKMTDEVINSVPKDMKLVYWDYNHTDIKHFERQIKGHKKFKNELWYSGAIWSNLGYSSHTKYSNMVADASINACINEGIENVLITSWKDDGAEASIFIILPSLAHIASIVYEKDEREIFKDSVGYDIDDFMLLDLPDEVYGDIDIYNPSKYGLYNDPLLGLCDYHLREIDHNYFKNIKERIEKVNNPEFGYIFDTVAKMCDVMEYKMDLGIRTRNAYLNGDKTELERLANEIYPLVAERIKNLYDSACYQWEKEAKLNGFEVQDIRLGGLEKRIRHISRILKMYLNGEIERIESLEEKPQAFYMNKKEGEGIILSIWEQTAMTKPWN